jgi:hypothetical protein
MPWLRRVLVPAAALLVTGGLEHFEDGGAFVNVFSTHHATPDEDGVFPDRGDDDMPRIFEVGDGWQVTLLESYVTIAGVSLIDCEGIEHPLNMFWGPCPEDLRSRDLRILTVAGSFFRPTQFCALEVTYGPYETPVVDEDAEETTQHEVPENADAIRGATVYLRGAATHENGDVVPFELTTGQEVTVSLDLSELEGPGRPLTVRKNENFPKELTISKTYDRFFDGADWETFDAGDAQRQLDAILATETRVVAGQIVDPEMFM